LGIDILRGNKHGERAAINNFTGTRHFVSGSGVNTISGNFIGRMQPDFRNGKPGGRSDNDVPKTSSVARSPISRPPPLAT